MTTHQSTGITFSFGRNWQHYVENLTEEQVSSARGAIERFLGRDRISRSRVIDVGSGSGIHSLAFLELGAREVLSLDVDSASVAATRSLHDRAGKPSNWSIREGSILDRVLAADLGRFDIVYAWGVLPHTGELWAATDATCSLVAEHGALLLGIYARGPNYARHLKLKQRYNAASRLGKSLMEWRFVLRTMFSRLWRLESPTGWNERKDRGMDAFHDIRDWLGGLPYEVASEDEVLRFCRERAFELERIEVLGEGGNNTYLFQRQAS